MQPGDGNSTYRNRIIDAIYNMTGERWRREPSMNCDNAYLLLYAVTDRSWLHGQTLYEQAEQALQGGATFLQLREKNWTRRIFKRRPSSSRHCANSTACRSSSMTTWRSPWHGRRRRARRPERHGGRQVRALGPDKILGVSAQTVEQALLAERERARIISAWAPCSRPGRRPTPTDVP